MYCFNLLFDKELRSIKVQNQQVDDWLGLEWLFSEPSRRMVRSSAYFNNQE